MKVLSRVTAVATACALTLSIAPASYAATTTSTSHSSTSVTSGSPEDQMSQAEMAKLEKDVEILFTKYLQTDSSGKFFVNVQNLAADGAKDRAPELQQLAETFNMLGKAPAESTIGGPHSTRPGTTVQPYNAGDFASCLALNALGIPAVGGSPTLFKALKEGISAWNWGLTAKTVARIIGPTAAKALGGPVGIGVALAWGAYSCRGKL